MTGKSLSDAIVFIGPMASGKSSIGRQVAEQLSIPFIDTDEQIIAEHGPITEIFATQGEAVFRRLEEMAVTKALSQPGRRVVSLGGGAILSEKTRAALKNHTVILLMTDEETVLSRANLDKRPLLKNDPQAWSRLLQQRLPLYTEVATKTFEVAWLPKDVSAKKIVLWLETEVYA